MAATLITASPQASTALSITVRPRNAADKSEPRVYARSEFAVTLSGGAAPYANPYDPDEVAVDAMVTGPDAKPVTIPAFWYAPYTWKDAKNADVEPVTSEQPGWRLRFAPTAPGKWKLVMRVRDKSGTATSNEIVFTVAPAQPDQHGFVRRATGAGKARYFEYSSGTPYFLVGENLGWADKRGLPSYAGWLGALGKAEANFVRLWMAPRNLETKDSGVGRYDQRNAAYFDTVLDLAEQNGIACMLALDTYGDFVTGGYFNEGKWGINPYNARNGGPVPQDAPDVFFTDPTARKLYRNRLRYLIARYGAYTSVGFWEFWNERAAPPDWLREMATYVKKTDPYNHPVTNSYQITGPAEAWNIPELDLSQTHRYGDEGSIKDFAPGLSEDARAHALYRKPHLMGEFGITWRGPDTPFDPHGTGINIHNGIWASALSGNAGGAMTWWWDSYVAPKNLYPVFTGFARFAKSVDWSHRAFEPISLASPALGSASDAAIHDLILPANAAWGAKTGKPVVIDASGAITGQDNIIGYLYGPAKPDLRSRQEIQVNLPRPGTLRLRIGTVSDKSELRVAVDGKPVATWKLDPTPTGKGTYQETKYLNDYKLYQARFDTDKEIPLPAGKHTIAIENVSGDWVTMTSYAIVGVYPRRFAPLRPLALQEASSGETLVWLQDPESNWANDREGIAPATWKNIRLTIPVPKPGNYRLAWWDTRKGTIASTTTATTIGTTPELTVSVPKFTRDIALHAIPAP